MTWNSYVHTTPNLSRNVTPVYRFPVNLPLFLPHLNPTPLNQNKTSNSSDTKTKKQKLIVDKYRAISTVNAHETNFAEILQRKPPVDHRPRNRPLRNIFDRRPLE